MEVAEIAPAEEKSEVNRKGNSLAFEPSPYLLQHAQNPVDWLPWGTKAIELAKKADKPIFLSIGYSACHWCHVMEEESFEDPEVAEALNRDFISIKVDREERPDIDDIYMSCVQMMTGGGGWPLTVFMHPNLKPFFGGTYFPKESSFGRPSFSLLIGKIADAWRNRRSDIMLAADSVTQALKQMETERPNAGGANISALRETAYNELVASFDRAWGGWGNAPKFPAPGSLKLLMRYYVESGENDALEMVNVTLKRMSQGGMYDHVGGGFHRYSVDRMWLVPHFEKMLSDNAQLAGVYTEAYQITADKQFARLARHILGYMIRDMQDREGGFYTSEDADSAGREGSFYVWSKEQIDAVLGSEKSELFCAHYGVTERGNFEGRNILSISRFGWNESDQFSDMRDFLLAERSKRERPHLDDKVIAALNGMAISALARSFQVLGGDELLGSALNAGRFVLTHMVTDGQLAHYYRCGSSHVDGFLDDYASVANAFIDLYETVFDPTWIEQAVSLCNTMTDRFGDNHGKGLFYAADTHEELLVRSKSYMDHAVPSGNAAAALALARLARYTGDEKRRAAAEGILSGAADGMRLSSQMYANMICAGDLLHSPLLEIVVSGDLAHPDTKSVLAEVRRRFNPSRVVVLAQLGHEEPDRLARLIPALKGRAPRRAAPTLYVCRDSVCQLPVTDVRQVAQLLDEAEKR